MKIILFSKSYALDCCKNIQNSILLLIFNQINMKKREV